MGARAYTLIEEFAFEPEDTVIEIGSERGEGSTNYFSEFCKANDIEFHSVDIDPHNNIAERAKGEEWLAKYNKQIGFAYLDNFDYIFDSIIGKDWVEEQIKGYKKFGMVMNNKNSELAHFLQAKEVLRLSRVGTEILFDDTWLDGVYRGKGATAVPYLLDNGFTVVSTGGKEHKGYVLVRRIA